MRIRASTSAPRSWAPGISWTKPAIPSHSAGVNSSSSPIYLTQCPAGNATCPEGGYVLDDNIFEFSSIYPGGFTPRFVGDTEEIYATIGYKGEASSGLRYDFSVSSSRNTLALSMYDSISPSYGAESQTSFEFGDLIQEELVANIDLSYEIDAGLASAADPLGWPGISRKKPTSRPKATRSPTAPGPTRTPHPLFVETAPGSGVFTDTGTFTAVETPSASGYGGTSPTYAGKAQRGQLWRLRRPRSRSDEPAERRDCRALRGVRQFWRRDSVQAQRNLQGDRRFAVRATLGSGFHAPSPGQNNVQVLTTNFIAGVSVQTGTYPVTSAIAQFYGAQALKPEESDNYGVGFVFNPTDNFELTADVYRIDVSDRIYISQTFNSDG